MKEWAARSLYGAMAAFLTRHHFLLLYDYTAMPCIGSSSGTCNLLRMWDHHACYLSKVFTRPPIPDMSVKAKEAHLLSQS